MARLTARLTGDSLAAAAAPAQAVRLVAVAVELRRRLVLVALGALLQLAELDINKHKLVLQQCPSKVAFNEMPSMADAPGQVDIMVAVTKVCHCSHQIKAN